MPASFASSPAVVTGADVADCVQSEDLGMLSQALVAPDRQMHLAFSWSSLRMQNVILCRVLLHQQRSLATFSQAAAVTLS